MSLTLFLRTRGKPFHAEAEYDGSVMIVKKGAIVNTNLSGHIRGGTKSRSYLNNPEFVNENGLVLENCVFKSPSTAAQFVNGNSTNGLLAWKTREGIPLKDILNPEKKYNDN